MHAAGKKGVFFELGDGDIEDLTVGMHALGPRALCGDNEKLTDAHARGRCWRM